MKQFTNSTGTLLVIPRGDDVITRLEAFATDNNLIGAWISGGVGGASHAVLSFYDIETKSYVDQSFEEPLEILNLQGNLAIVDGKPFWHMHGVFSDKGYKAIGGHVKSLTIGLTCELFITPLNIELTRQSDEETGLKLLS